MEILANVYTLRKKILKIDQAFYPSVTLWIK
jgi:hypothetical protein